MSQYSAIVIVARSCWLSASAAATMRAIYSSWDSILSVRYADLPRNGSYPVALLLVWVINDASLAVFGKLTGCRKDAFANPMVMTNISIDKDGVWCVILFVCGCPWLVVHNQVI